MKKANNGVVCFVTPAVIFSAIISLAPSIPLRMFATLCCALLPRTRSHGDLHHLTFPSLPWPWPWLIGYGYGYGFALLLVLQLSGFIPVLPASLLAALCMPSSSSSGSSFSSHHSRSCFCFLATAAVQLCDFLFLQI